MAIYSEFSQEKWWFAIPWAQDPATSLAGEGKHLERRASAMVPKKQQIQYWTMHLGTFKSWERNHLARASPKNRVHLVTCRKKNNDTWHKLKTHLPLWGKLKQAERSRLNRENGVPIMGHFIVTQNRSYMSNLRYFNAMYIYIVVNSII